LGCNGAVRSLGSLDTPEYEASQFLLVVATYKTKTSTNWLTDWLFGVILLTLRD